MDTDTNITPPVEPTAVDTSAPADEIVTSTQTEATPEATQPQENTAEVNAEDTVSERLYAGKYKSVEDLEKSYQELNSKFSSTSQEKAELSRILNEAFSTPAAEETPAYGEENYDTGNPREDARDRDIALLKFTMAHQDANGADMAQVLKTDPYVNNIQSYDAKLEYAYLKAQNTARDRALADAQKKGAQEVEAKFVEKQAAQVETARTQAPPTGNEELSKDQLRNVLKDDKAFDELMQKRFPGVSQMRSKR